MEGTQANLPCQRPHNHVFNHVALSVPNLDEACNWYEKIFGFRQIAPNKTIDREEHPNAGMFKIYGPRLKRARIASLSCGNGVGLELFEFVDPPFRRPSEDFDFARGGFFHIAITVPDPEAMAKSISEARGRQIGEAVNLSGETALYCADPWGNVLECISGSFEMTIGNRMQLSR